MVYVRVSHIIAPVKACPNTSCDAGVSSLGVFVFSIVNEDASKSAFAVWVTEYLRLDRQTDGLYSGGKKPNRAWMGRENSRPNILENFLAEVFLVISPGFSIPKGSWLTYLIYIRRFGPPYPLTLSDEGLSTREGLERKVSVPSITAWNVISF